MIYQLNYIIFEFVDIYIFSLIFILFLISNIRIFILISSLYNMYLGQKQRDQISYCLGLVTAVFVIMNNLKRSNEIKQYVYMVYIILKVKNFRSNIEHKGIKGFILTIIKWFHEDGQDLHFVEGTSEGGVVGEGAFGGLQLPLEELEVQTPEFQDSVKRWRIRQLVGVQQCQLFQRFGPLCASAFMIALWI